jgi:hypothetical protein
MFILIIHEGRWISTSNLTILKYIKSVINTWTKVDNKLPGYIKEIDSYMPLRKS